MGFESLIAHLLVVEVLFEPGRHQERSPIQAEEIAPGAGGRAIGLRGTSLTSTRCAGHACHRYHQGRGQVSAWDEPRHLHGEG